jgi:hypothetical protein
VQADLWSQVTAKIKLEAHRPSDCQLLCAMGPMFKTEGAPTET